MDRAKIAGVADFPQPRNSKHVGSCLRMCKYMYYQKFIKDYSKISVLPFESSYEEKYQFPVETRTFTVAFNLLKRKLTSAFILVFHDFSKPFVLSVAVI